MPGMDSSIHGTRSGRLRRLLARALRGGCLRPVMSPAEETAAGRGLHKCRECGLDHVCPVEWKATDEAHWWMLLRCGDCGVWQEVMATNAEAAELDQVLDRHVALIERALARLDAERMAREIEAFVGALSHDLIDAADFA